MQERTWRDIIGKRYPEGHIILVGTLTGTFIEEQRRGVYFSIEPPPGVDHYPIIEGPAFVAVDFPHGISDQRSLEMRNAARDNRRVIVRGVYKRRDDPMYAGQINAEFFELFL